MEKRKIAFYIVLFFTACRSIVGCKEYDDSGSLILGFAYDYMQMDTSDPLVCLVFSNSGYYACLLDGTVDLSSDSLDSSFRERKDLLLLDDWNDLPPEIVYDVVHVDSNLVFCRFKPEYQKNRFDMKYRNIRTDVGKWGDATDDRDYLSGYYMYFLSTTYSTQERKIIMDSKKYPPQDSIWNVLYERRLAPYLQRRLEIEQDTISNNITVRQKLHLLFESLKCEISYAYYRSRHPRAPRQTLPLNEALQNCEKVKIHAPLLYLPFPLGSSAYIFDRGNIARFEEDSFYCGKQNFYATYYELPSELEQLCRIISYDSNGVLAEMLPESNETDYILTLIPESGSVARAHLLNSESFVRRLHMRSLPADSVWSEVRASDHGHVPLPDYDPQVFINAYPLVDAYAKTMEK